MGDEKGVLHTASGLCTIHIYKHYLHLAYVQNLAEGFMTFQMKARDWVAEWDMDCSILTQQVPLFTLLELLHTLLHYSSEGNLVI